MPAVTVPMARTVRLTRWSTAWPAVAAWTLGFAVVAYLAFSNGGYDTVVRNQVGIALWWLVLLGAIAGLLPGRLPRAAWVAVGLLAAFVIWTAISTSWSESPERTWGDAGKVATYLSFLILGLAAQRRAGGRHLLNGVTSAIGLVAVLALLSRLHPLWFPVDDQGAFLHNTARLAYPLNYWNALAAMMAIGLPLTLATAAGARRVLAHSVTVAVVPVLALCAWFTESRGGVISVSVALIVWLALAHDRLARAATMVVAGAGSAILIVAADQRPILGQGLRSAAAVHAGDRFIALVVIVCGGVGALAAAIALAERHAERPRWLRPTPRTWLASTAAVILLALAIAVAAGVPHDLHHAWSDFKAPPASVSSVPAGNDPFARLQSTNSHGRYQYWQAALNAERSHPWRGIGSGAFEFWWSRHPATDGFVRDAHSLYFQTFGELGVVGGLLIIGLIVSMFGVGAIRTLRASPESRTVLAGATAAVATWAIAAVYEWIWQMAAMAAILLLMGAVALAGRSDVDVAAEAAGGLGPAGSRGRRPPRESRSGRIVVAVLAVLALPVVAVPLAGANNIQASQASAAKGRVGSALRSARSAQRIEPYAATPRLQEALLLESAGQLTAAVQQARAATTDEPTNWRTWLIRTRIEAEAGHVVEAVRSYRRFRQLNPTSSLLALR